ncbi:MAG: 2-hydroxyacyl-CoA dehydratase [Firmicutes bacterium]|nr:2-hydroxyacyl-CoA dehydratase [Bacillota bacterium]
MMYYVCKYTPLELLAGFGIPMERLEPVSNDFELADRLAHANLCGYGKAVLEAAMQDEVQELILINCCDVIRKVYDVLKEKKNMKFLYFLDVPHGNGPAQARYFTEELKRLKAACENFTGREFSIYPFLKMWQEETGDINCKTPYISLLGAHIRPSTFNKITSAFPIPVQDDTCGGNRRLDQLPAAIKNQLATACENCDGLEEFDPLPLYAEALLGQTPCMRMQNRRGRDQLGKDASGIIYHTMKFCDYYSFEYLDRKETAEQPVLKIETDATAQSDGQLATRLEAFAESLHLRENTGSVMKNGKYVAGIDSGSTSTDVVIMDENKNIVGWAIVPTGAGASAGAQKALQQALEQHGIAESDLRRVVTTGYGREFIGKGDSSVTEITCHARGAHFLDPSVRTIIDIGGQDLKAIHIDEQGAVCNFAMNDKCAAGTGRFLEMMAKTLELSLEELSSLGEKWKKEVTISSMCTVFAESEVVSLVAGNTPPADIIHGLNQSVAVRVLSLIHRVSGEENYMMTGGVANNRGLVKTLEKKIGKPIIVSEYAQLCGAIGAALLAFES